MVATLALAGGKADRRRMRTWIGGSVIAGLGDSGDRQKRRHIVTICWVELLTLLVGAAECRRSSAV